MTNEDDAGVANGEAPAAATPWFCRQCSVEHGLAFEPHEHSEARPPADGRETSYLMVDCAGCDLILINWDGSCRGSPFCEKHDTTPTWKRVTRRAWYRCLHTYELVRDHVVPWRRHHMLDLRTPEYRHGWCDVDRKILHACFNLLTEFCTNEHPFDRVDWTQSPEMQHAATEIHELYQWWMHERLEEQFDPDDFDASRRREDEMLRRLLAVREYLWT